ncbi:MAG: hypothetical protein S4CHLAM6_00650 [Chlamydiae bacterium]|nr:hypothetical protein [Chlamydiota bacterium]
MSLLQLKIPARSRKCLGCEKRFEDGDKVFSTVEGEEEAPQRKDYCSACFDESSLEELIWGHWYIIIRKEKILLTPDQRAMKLFKEEQKGPNSEYLLFIAQYLKRKKQLIQRPEIKKEELLFFEDPKTSEVYGIPKTQIHPDKLAGFKTLFLEQLEASE